MVDKDGARAAPLGGRRLIPFLSLLVVVKLLLFHLVASDRSLELSGRHDT